MFPLLTTYVFPSIVFVIMIGLGLSLSVHDFYRVVTSFRSVLLGLSAQMIILPLIALAIVYSGFLSLLTSVGLIVLAACPGGVTSNAISFAVRADIALSVTLTAVSSVLVPFTLPLWLSFATNTFLSDGQSIMLPYGETLVQLAAMTILPVVIGMQARSSFPDRSAIVAEKFRVIAIILILFMCITTTLFNFSYLSDLQESVTSLIAALLLMCLTMLLGLILARRINLQTEQQLTIMIEVGVQNLAIALLVALTMLGDAGIARLPLIYGLLMVSLPWIFIRIVKSRNFHRDRDTLSS